MEAYEFAERLRRFRKEKAVSQHKVATQAGCSPSFISEAERGNVFPSIPTLKRISDALGVNIVDFFLPNSGNPDRVVTPPSERVEISMKRWRAKVNLLVKSTQGKRMQPFYTVIEPNGGALGSYAHEGEEFGIVIEGELEINLDGKRYRVRENESFYYSSQIPHGWTNPGKTQTIVVWVVSPPTW